MQRDDRPPLTCPATALPCPKGPCPGASDPGVCLHLGALAAARAAGPSAVPGPIEMAGDLARSVLAHAAGGFAQASFETQSDRERACRECEPHHDHAADACKLCGCGTNAMFAAAGLTLARKRSWASQSCPAGNWGPE